MKKFVLLALALALIAPAAADAASWKKLAAANDASEYYASATATTKSLGAKQVRLMYSGTGRMQIKGSVTCTNRAFDFESRDFTFLAKQGSRVLPLPLKGTSASCSWLINASMGDGGMVAFQLWAWR